jgi:hypothetical protein
VKKAGEMFARSRRFLGKSAKRNLEKEKWIEGVGVWWYYSLVLAQFDPIRASVIFDNPAHVIAEAFVSMMAYNHVEPEQ